MKGRKIPLLIGLLTFISLVLVIVATWDWFAETWYLRQLESEDPKVRKSALLGLGKVATVRSIPALIEAIQTDSDETLFIRNNDSPGFTVVTERPDEDLKKLYSPPNSAKPRKFFEFKDARIEGCGSTLVFCTPATFALYRVGKPALPTLRQIWKKQENGRAKWVFLALLGLLSEGTKPFALLRDDQDPRDSVNRGLIFPEKRW